MTNDISGHAVPPRTKRPRRTKIARKEEICGTVMAFIPVLRCILFSLIPMGLALVMAFYNMKKPVSFEGAKFCGLDNFKTLFRDPDFGRAAVNTLVYALTLPVSVFLALLVAASLNADVKGRGAFRVVLFLPYICSTVAIVYIWKWLYNTNYGIFNVILGKKIGWLDSPMMFRVSLILMMVWATTGYKVILLSAALTAVNGAYYEAAEIDGANFVQKFMHVTLPAVSPTVFFLLITGLISIFQMFSESQVMDPTGGQKVNYAGLTMVFYLYREGYSNAHMGLASAASWVLTAVILLVTVLNFKLSKLWVRYD